MPNEPVLVDTGALAALFDPNDQFHDRLQRSGEANLPVGKAFTCWPVHHWKRRTLLRRYPDKRDSLLESVEAGEFQLALTTSRRPTCPRCATFSRSTTTSKSTSPTQRCCFLADREGLEDVFTVDRRHFSLFRKQNGKPLRLIPRRVMLPRILEPEVMDSDEDAREYDAMDHAAVNAVFVTDY